LRNQHAYRGEEKKGEKVGVNREAGAGGERSIMVAVMRAVGDRHRKKQGIGEQRV
jgi:hypothetical protein